MDFFATGAFQQLYSDLEEPQLTDLQSSQLGYGSSSTEACCYADVNFGENYANEDYYGLTLLDSNNNSHNALELDFNAEESLHSSQEFSDWEQRLLDNFVEIPELIDFLPERTPLCTEMCNEFLQESVDNLRLATPATSSLMSTPTHTPSPPATPKLIQNAAGEKGYPCSYGSCQKLYAKPAHLKAHLRRHLGEKPYACSWPDCSWRFSRSDELARHRRSHSGIKPYKCDYCAKCFARSDHLTKHRKVHERRLLAATRAGKLLPNEPMPNSVYTVRPGRKRKNQI